MSDILINPVSYSEGFTQSELSTFGACAQKWFWRYNKLFEKKGSFSFALMVGSGAHEYLEQYYRTQGKRANVATLQFEEGVIASVADYSTLDYWNLVLPAMMRAYAIYWKNDHDAWDILSVEEDVDIEWEGFRLRGKIDLEFYSKKHKGHYILDHKTAARLTKEMVAGWDFRFQFMFYLWLKTKVKSKHKLNGYFINAIKKPELRVKQNETVPAFAQRVFQDMITEPEKYFYRDRYPVTKERMQHFEDFTVRPRLRLMSMMNDPSLPFEIRTAVAWNKNTDECQHYTGAPCPYIDLCQHGERAMGFLYETREVKHKELENGAETDT